MRMISMLIRMDHPNARYSTSKQKQQLKLLILVLQLIKSMGNVTDGQLSIFMIFLKVNFHRNHPSPVKGSGFKCPILTSFDQFLPQMTFGWSNTGKILANSTEIFNVV